MAQARESTICECPHENCGALFESHHRPGEMTCCPACGRQQAPHVPTLDVMGREIRELWAVRDKLQAFKDWVHNYLDQCGVPHHPDGKHRVRGRDFDKIEDALAAEPVSL